ncbi:LysM peptidoglycan-binding domain-containing protein [Rubritalea marina]|uniref:LysM peptidoglycan-binding domain-containing protein n=1 Tax=Rubritalea marina TaxID=361055 RepID=UPI000369A0C9|nr:LysM peptidoglycan-binding domain-containing protein [Rubritalea marina]
MNSRKLQTNRVQPQKKRGIRAVHARVSSGSRRKQAVAAASTRPGELQAEVPHKSLASVWMVVIILHVVAVGVIYVAIEWNKSQLQPLDLPSANVASSNEFEGLEPKLVKSGDTYESFATRHKVSVEKLRALNKNTTIHAGKVLYLPKEEQVEPVMVKVQPSAEGAAATVKAVVVEEAKSLAESYTVVKGDSIYRIAKAKGVSQDALMAANGIEDARQLRVGQKLEIPLKK